MDKNVHLIGNAHIDPVWLWNWPDGYMEVLTTFRSALDRMNENGSYIFSCAGAAYYTWVEETDPKMFEEIRARVKEGRWVIVGGWWIQPDCNLPCGESFARHALYSQRYFESRFGIKAEIGYNVDSFGHNGMLSQILRESGMRGYVYMRPGQGAEKSYPFEENAFLWESPDGSQIPAYRINESYGSAPFGEAAEKAQDYHKRAKAQQLPQMCFYGVGNHGGGPTKENLKALDELMAASEEGSYGYSSPNEYFTQLEKAELPVLKDELQHHASGCYTTMMEIKSLNRKAEAKLLAAEKYWTMAKMLGLKKETPDFERIWRKVLFNQFHDILCGCSIKSACEHAEHELAAGAALAGEIENEAIQAIAWNIDTLKDGVLPAGKYEFLLWDNNKGVPAIVFNPHSWDAKVEVCFPAEVKEVRDEEGNVVPVQKVRAEFTNFEDKYVSMIHAEVPAMGWRLYRIYRKPISETENAPEEKMLGVTENSLENEWTKAVFDAETGRLISVFDKTENRELLGAPASARVADETDSDTWSHAIFTFHNYVGEFAQPKFRIVENGAVRAVLEVCTSWNNSTMRQRYIMYREKPGVYVEHKVLWLEQHKMLKLCFPTTDAGALPVSSMPYGFMERRADGRDYPMQTWVAMMKDGKGLGVATDTRTAYDAENGELSITALRSPIYADHFGIRDEECEFMAQGEHEFTLYIGSVNGSTLDLQHTGALLASPLPVIVGGDHKGKFEMKRSMVHTDAKNVEITVVKTAEDGSEDLIIRCHEMEGKEAEAKITVDGFMFDAAFTPQQIRTFRVSGGKVTVCDMLEDEK